EAPSILENARLTEAGEDLRGIRVADLPPGLTSERVVNALWIVRVTRAQRTNDDGRVAADLPWQLQRIVDEERDRVPVGPDHLQPTPAAKRRQDSLRFRHDTRSTGIRSSSHAAKPPARFQTWP